MCRLIVFASTMFLCALAAAASASSADTASALKDYRADKFGMFIHWNFSVVPAESWKKVLGFEPTHPVTDRDRMWLVARRKLPLESYRNLSREFNPVKWDAEAVVKLAKNAGMKYIVFTSKHHDGFAMFDSKVSDYTIVKATPYGRDVVKDLADACHKHGIKLCFYYSHAQDWEQPDAAGNDWDFATETKDFSRYFNSKCKPQVKELLSNYGRVDLMWFDTPAMINADQSKELYDMVKNMQPWCVVNSRVGGNVYDYLSLGDNQVPSTTLNIPWETCATLNDHWPYSPDQKYKDVKEILIQLCTIVGRGGNLLLNIGPTDLGDVPQPSIDRLDRIGDWLQVNGEAVYGTNANPLKINFNWGTATCRKGKIYLFVYNWPQSPLDINGFNGKVTKAYTLADKKTVAVSQSFFKDSGVGSMSLTLPKDAPDKIASVVVLEVDNERNVCPITVQQPVRTLTLEALASTIHKTDEKSGIVMADRAAGYVERWYDTRDRLSWKIKLVYPGKYRAYITLAKKGKRDNDTTVFDYDKPVSAVLSVGRASTKGILTSTELAQQWGMDPNRVVVLDAGELSLKNPGSHEVVLWATAINRKLGYGFTVKSVTLEPVED